MHSSKEAKAHKADGKSNQAAQENDVSDGSRNA